MSSCHWEQMDSGHFLFTQAFEYIFYVDKFMAFKAIGLFGGMLWSFVHVSWPKAIKVMLLTTKLRDRIQEFKVSTPKKYRPIKDWFLTKLNGDINTIIQQVKITVQILHQSTDEAFCLLCFWKNPTNETTEFFISENICVSIEKH